MRPFPIRERDDKTAQYLNHEPIYGNAFGPALGNICNLLNPITSEFLDNPFNACYFSKKEFDEEYTDFKRFGLNVRYSSFRASMDLLGRGKKLSVIDIGAGRNVNYKNYLMNGF